MKVKDIMQKRLITARKDATLSQVAALMLKHNIGCVPIVNEKKELLGIVTETDFMPKQKDLPFSSFRLPRWFGEWMTPEHMEEHYKKASKLSAGDLMTPYVHTLEEDELVSSAVNRMLEQDIKHIPIVRAKKLVGIVTRHDILQLLHHKKIATPRPRMKSKAKLKTS